MQGKIELKLEDLKVESFETTADGSANAGTVFAHNELLGGYTHPPYDSCPPKCYTCAPYCEATLCAQDGCDTKNESCGGSCNHCPDEIEWIGNPVNREAL